MQYGKLAALITVMTSLTACTILEPDRAPVVATGPTPVETAVKPAKVESEGTATNFIKQVNQQNVTTAAQADGTVVTTVPAAVTTPVVAPTPVQAAPKPVVQPVAPSTVRQVGGGKLSLNLNYNQAWSQVGKVLPAAGYQIMSTDSAMGNYSIMDTTKSGGIIKRDTPVYMVHLEKQGDNNTLVTVSSSNNQPVDQIYSTLRGKL
ncbi:MAG: hypothetical protein QM752_04975 [Gammaproteobacteria bacterium]